MADGADRVHGSLWEAAEALPGEWAVLGATTSATSAGGEVGKGPSFLGDAHVHIDSEKGNRVQVTLDFCPDQMSFDHAMSLAKAVWEGAASKGFPNPDWKY